MLQERSESGDEAPQSPARRGACSPPPAVGVAAAVALGLGDDPEPAAQPRRRHARPPRRRPRPRHRRDARRATRSRSASARTSSASSGTTSSSAPSASDRLRIVSAKTGKVRSYAPKIGVGVNDGAVGFGSLWLAVGARRTRSSGSNARTGRPRGNPIQLPGPPGRGRRVAGRGLGRARPGQRRARQAAQDRPADRRRRSRASTTRTGSGRSRPARPRSGSRPAAARRSSASSPQTGADRQGRSASAAAAAEDIVYRDGCAVGRRRPRTTPSTRSTTSTGELIPISVGRRPRQLARRRRRGLRHQLQLERPVRDRREDARAWSATRSRCSRRTRSRSPSTRRARCGSPASPRTS